MVGLCVEICGTTPGKLLEQMASLGGLEPPTWTLSGAGVSEDCPMTQKSAGRAVHGIVGHRSPVLLPIQRHQI
jgi:hypothetical protein